MYNKKTEFQIVIGIKKEKIIMKSKKDRRRVIVIVKTSHGQREMKIDNSRCAWYNISTFLCSILIQKLFDFFFLFLVSTYFLFSSIIYSETKQSKQTKKYTAFHFFRAPKVMEQRKIEF